MRVSEGVCVGEKGRRKGEGRPVTLEEEIEIMKVYILSISLCLFLHVVSNN
jgi:hypothetical protein